MSLLVLLGFVCVLGCSVQAICDEKYGVVVCDRFTKQTRIANMEKKILILLLVEWKTFLRRNSTVFHPLVCLSVSGSTSPGFNASVSSNQTVQNKCTVPRSSSIILVFTKQYALLNKMHTHTSLMTFNGIATMFLLVGGSMIRSGYQQLFWQLGTVTVDLSIGSKSARTCVSSFAITFTKVFTPPNCLCIK